MSTPHSSDICSCVQVPSILLLSLALWTWPVAEYAAQLANGGGVRSDMAFLAESIAPVPIAPVVLPLTFGLIGVSVLLN